MECIVYILRTSKNTLYVGQTNDINRRLQEHQKKGSRAAKYTRGFASIQLVYTESVPTKSDALKREAVLKRLSHAQKEQLIRSWRGEGNSVQ